MASINIMASANIGSAAIPAAMGAMPFRRQTCGGKMSREELPACLPPRAERALPSYVMAAGLHNYFAHKVRKAPERPTKDADIWSVHCIL